MFSEGSWCFSSHFFKPESGCAVVLTCIPCIVHLCWYTENLLQNTEIFSFTYMASVCFYHGFRFFPKIPYFVRAPCVTGSVSLASNVLLYLLCVREGQGPPCWAEAARIPFWVPPGVKIAAPSLSSASSSGEKWAQGLKMLNMCAEYLNVCRNGRQV